MQRTNSRIIDDRLFQTVGRVTLDDADDTHLWQEQRLRAHHNEQMREIEYAQPYGFTSYPKKPTKENGKKREAEGIIVFPHGARSHGVVIVMGDRRYRLKKIAEGEIALYDDLGQQVHLTRNGIVMSAPRSKKIVAQIMESDDRPKDTEQQQGQQNQQTTETKNFGQVPQTTKTVYASFTLTKDSFVIEHPTMIEHKVGANTSVKLTTSGVEVKGVTVTNQGLTRVECVGPTYIGIDSKGETGPKVQTESGLAKQAFAKV